MPISNVTGRADRMRDAPREKPRQRARNPSLAPLLRLVLRHSDVLVGVLLVGFVALYVAMALKLRADAWEQAMMSADNLLRSVGADVSRSVGDYRDTFGILAAELADADRNRLAGGHERVAVRAHSALVRTTGDLFLFDADGAIQERSHHFLAREALKRRGFLDHHRRDPSTAVRVGEPFRDPSTGNTVLWVSQRLEKGDGSFAGVVAGTLDTGSWRHAFERLSIGPRSSINLFHVDGTLMMRVPFVAERVGSNLSGTDNFRRFASAPSGAFVGRAAIDGEKRAYRFARVEGAPLILNVATSTSEIEAGWWRGTLVSGAVVTVLAGLAVALRLVLSRELRRRRESEARYRTLSDVDGLTGIANRRLFDEALASERDRSAATGMPLSAILLDVDHFKSFNDRYGHQAGDACLRDVAAAVRAAAGCGDLAARYGGEEFVVLLPGTDGRDSLAVAERIRAAVEAMALPHAGNPPSGVVTVSLGVATVHPADAPPVASLLVSAADRALYRAKRAGRNRAERQDPAQPGPEAPEAEGEDLRPEAVDRLRPRPAPESRRGFGELAGTAAGTSEAPLAFVAPVGDEREDVAERSTAFHPYSVVNGLAES